ncbi:glycoside hydrolase family 79 protein [Myriangium duriaei CBS 260.36]|uniref:Glycoside hydrolase family 79 protein n=1 Tax=Myriangium duriaei CBS 260.36 TaxID=1168546 RepID=A0A9P4J2D0_9PEZI|nr:glycoside hydrolase family 79 protein [Myriangium duriaei CBS 260.36]
MRTTVKLIVTLAAWVSTIDSRPGVSQTNAVRLDIPCTPDGASSPLDNTFASLSIEPAYWYEYFGNFTDPNRFTFDLLDRISEHGGRPNIRPGGITMDSMLSDPSAGDPVRTTDAKGGVYRLTVGPNYYRSWGNFPNQTKFISTLNLGNNSLAIAEGLALASGEYAGPRILSFELGNEPTNYPSSRWDNSTAAYVEQWQNWTSQIDATVDATGHLPNLGSQRWFASSATTDDTPLHVQPVNLIPAGIDSRDQVSYYSIHSYPFSTCDPTRAALATIEGILNHTELVEYAVNEIYPSAKAALQSGSKWVIGEFNSISCSGKPNVSDTFAQALWTIDSDLIYASLNASNVYLHQGATLAFQSNDQTNTAGPNGTPGFSTYSIVYPRDSALRGSARALPSFLSQLFMGEVFASNDTRVRRLEAPSGVEDESFAAYGLYNDSQIKKLAIVNMKPYYANSTSDHSVTVDISSIGGTAWVKRLTAPHVDEQNSTCTTWAGQSFPLGIPIGEQSIEVANRSVTVRGSEAVLVFFDKDQVIGLDC